MKKIHTYAGLLSFTAFLVWGITGIHAVFLPAPGGWHPPDVSEQRRIPFTVPGNLSDRDLARRIVEVADIPMGTSAANIRRDENQNLVFSMYTVNGRWDVTCLEEQETLLLEARRNDIWGFLSSMHAGHPRRGSSELPARMWGFYNEFSTWAFVFMSLSGIYLWLATRPRIRWVQLLAVAGVILFIAMWAWTR